MEFRVSPLYYRDSVATKRFDSLQRFKDETYLTIINGIKTIPALMKKMRPLACGQVQFNEVWYTGLKIVFARKLQRLSMEAMMENNDPVNKKTKVSQFSANIKARVKRTNNEAVENYFFVWQI